MQVSEYIWYLKYQISVKDRQLEAFRNGHKYTSLRADYETECNKLKSRFMGLNPIFQSTCRNTCRNSYFEKILVRNS